MAEAGDVLLSVRAPVGDLNVAYERCCIGRGLGAIHGRNGYQSFVLYTLFALRPQLDVYNGEGTVFGSINRNALNDMPIDIPSEEAIAAFEAVVRPMDNMIRSNYEENCRLQELRDSLLPRLMSGEVDVSDIQLYRRTNLVKSEKFSEIIQSAMNRYLNGMLTNEQVIEELLKLAKDIAAAAAEGDKLGLTQEEMAFYDALTKPQAIKDFYENDELIAITKELTDLLRNNRTIDWQKKESARAGMRRLVKRLLKKHKYPPEGMDDAVQTVMSQCEMWTDNVMTA